MWRRFNDFANNTMSRVDGVRKLIYLLASVLAAGFGLGVIWEKYITAHPAPQLTTVAASAATSGSKVCDVLSEISRVQATYGTQIEPVQARWLELTAKLERGDMLKYERENVTETVKLVQRELQRLGEHHQEIVTGIARTCIPK